MKSYFYQTKFKKENLHLKESAINMNIGDNDAQGTRSSGRNSVENQVISEPNNRMFRNEQNLGVGNLI